MNPNRTLPARILKLASKADRDKLGLGLTSNEAHAKNGRRIEAEMHASFESWLRLNEISYIHSRMDKKPTIREGWPDFTCIAAKRMPGREFLPLVCFVEFKRPGAGLRPEQEEVIAELWARNLPCRVCITVGEAIDFTRVALKL